MIYKEIVTITGKKFDYTYAETEGTRYKIERDGEVYDEAYDPVGSCREYVETEVPVETVEAE